jgi:type II secretion system protein H
VTGASGFTLTELVVVLVIMGIMAAMVIPQMQGSYEDALLRSSSRKIISALGLAYAQTVSKNQIHRVRLEIGPSATTRKYVIEKKARGVTINDGFVPVRDLGGSEGEIDSRIMIQMRHLEITSMSGETENGNGNGGANNGGFEPVEAITFYPDGTADGTEILLQDRAGFKLVLQVNPVTGRVEIAEPQGEQEAGR